MKNNLFHNKSILITGATGSIGSAITEEILKYNCKVVRAMSNDEDGIYGLSEKLTRKNVTLTMNMKKNKIRYLVGDIRDFKRCINVCKNIDIVIHAAAMKHVPVCEYNPDEAKKTNVLGTKNMINAAIKCKVKKFLFVSTDKAVNPSSWMGKTKLKAESEVLKSNFVKKNNNTLFSVIRFGNVIGSRGSVLPKFLTQIRLNQSLSVTDKKITRFFITIDLAVKGVLDAIKIMQGNEKFIIYNMLSLKIYDLAKTLKKYFKYNKRIIIKGLRDGEKLYEELATKKEMQNYYIKKNLLIMFNSKNIKKKNITSNEKIYSLSSKNAKLLNENLILKFLKKSKLI
jgi:FlaA1/EpsC-like NDP-sugar epimerase